MMRYAVLLLMVGCSSMEAPQAVRPQPEPVVEPTYEAHWETVEQEDMGQGWARAEDIPKGQMPRRLEVDQLRQSIPRLFAGIQWLDVSGNSMWDRLSRTLGEADYREVTEDNVEPTPLFAKFMDDMASQVCRKAIDHDARQANAEQRLLIRYLGDADRNLRWLQLKLHGRISPPQGDESLASYRRLADDILARTGQAETAWLGVCIAMLTAPEFLAY